ncbi:MAG TPA: enolase C-terminal domain-like protein [Gammaproteobacteria bacterium]
MDKGKRRHSRRAFLQGSAAAALAAATSIGWPRFVRAQDRLTLRFRTIPDPDGWHASLRLKGDWLVLEVNDGVLSGFGEASHSNDDEACKRAAAEIFAEHYAGLRTLSLETLATKEREIAALDPDFVRATAFSGLNQALYDLLAKREQVPVWQLFRTSTTISGIPLYTTINRALPTRTPEEYSAVVSELARQGFKTFKCAPFEAVNGPDRAVEKAAAGLATLARLREQFPDLAMRVDFHERFRPEDFYRLIPELERLQLDWIEEPFALGPAYTELKRRTRLRIAGGELFWGTTRFAEIAKNGWAHVIMPDVKHVGGFGPLLEVIRNTAGQAEVSPHNPSGPISTAASLHAAAIYPELVHILEYAFDRAGTRRATGERVEDGVLLLSDRPGWGVEPPG